MNVGSLCTVLGDSFSFNGGVVCNEQTEVAVKICELGVVAVTPVGDACGVVICDLRVPATSFIVGVCGVMTTALEKPIDDGFCGVVLCSIEVPI